MSYWTYSKVIQEREREIYIGIIRERDGFFFLVRDSSLSSRACLALLILTFLAPRNFIIRASSHCSTNLECVYVCMCICRRALVCAGARKGPACARFHKCPLSLTEDTNEVLFVVTTHVLYHVATSASFSFHRPLDACLLFIDRMIIPLFAQWILDDIPDKLVGNLLEEKKIESRSRNRLCENATTSGKIGR